MRNTELINWKQEVDERIDQLAKYGATLRTVEGRLGQIRYNVNSQITRMADERQEFSDLEKQHRETKRAFKADFPDVPATLGGIEKAIRHYKGIAASIEIQLEHEAQSVHEHEEHTITTEAGWSELVAEASKNREGEPPPPEQHTPPKRSLRDLYTPDAEHPEQPDQDRDRSR